MINLALTPRPFAAREHLTVTAGRTVRALLADLVAQERVSIEDLPRGEIWVDGLHLDRTSALDHVLAEGESVLLDFEARGGGGGGGKDVGQIMLQIAVIAVSTWIGGPAGAGLGLKSVLLRTVLSGATLALGNAAIASLYKPEAAGGAVNERYALQAASNNYRPWSPQPLALGEVVVAPDLAAKTFTQNRGDDVWIHGILALHRGPCEIADLKIGDTLVSSLTGDDAQFAYHLTPGPRTFSLYPNDVDQLDLSEELEATVSGSTPVVRAGSGEGQRFDFDFFFPAGLHFQKDDGRIISTSITLTVRYRAIDEEGAALGSWTDGLTVPLTSTTRDPWRITRFLTLPFGRYEFEVKRSAKPDGNEKRRDRVVWTAVRSVAFRKPVVDEQLSLIEFAVRATALNQGTLAPITCRITPVCEVWDGVAWAEPEPTSNPAALTRWLMTGPAAVLPLTTGQADVGLREWSGLCDTYDWRAGLYVTDEKTQADLIKMLAEAGRAGVYWDGSALVATPWVEKPAPIQSFTDVNLRDHAWEIIWPEPVHALRMEFQNLEEAGEWDEVFVYADGYAEQTDVGEGLTAATLVETVRLDGQMTPQRAWRDGRWMLGRRQLQRRVDTWRADIEAVVCRYGDRVRLAWKRTSGEGGARIRCRRWSGETVTGLRLDRPVTFIAGEDYCVDLRLAGQLITGVPVVNPAVTEPLSRREIVFVTPRSSALCPGRGDLIAFGIAEKVSEDVEIVDISPAEGNQFALTAVRYVAPQLMAAETGPIPELPGRLSRDRAKDPPAPVLLGVQTAPEGVRVDFAMSPWRGAPLTGFAVRWRRQPGEGETVGWTPLPDLAASAGTLTTPALSELAGEDDLTAVVIEIVAMTSSGRVSLPLTVVARVANAPEDEDTRAIDRILSERLTRFEAWLLEQERRRAVQRDALDRFDVLADDLDVVNGRARLRGILDIGGSTLSLLGVADRTELGFDGDGNVNRPLRPDIIFDSGLVTGLDLDTATDGLTGLIDGVVTDLELVEGDVGDLVVVVDGHTGDIGGLVTDLGLVETDLVALDGVVDGITIGADGTMSGGRGSVTILGLGFTGDLDANRITNTNELTDGANLGGTATWTGTSGRPENLVALVGTEPILNADISIGSDGALIGAGGGAVTLTGLGAGDLAVLDAVNLDDDVIEGAVNRFFTATEEGRLAGIEDGATAGADFGVNVSGVPVNLLALVGTEVLDNSEITLDADGSLLGGGGGAVTPAGLGVPTLSELAVTFGLFQDDLEDGTIVPLTFYLQGEMSKKDFATAGINIRDQDDALILQSRLVNDEGLSLGVVDGGLKRHSNGQFSPVSGQPEIIDAEDGEVVTFTTPYPVQPLVQYLNENLDALDAGEYYVCTPTGQSGSGFTARARKVTPGIAPTYATRLDDQTGSTFTEISEDGQTAYRQKGLSGVAYNERYVARVAARVRGVVTDIDNSEIPPLILYGPANVTFSLFGRLTSGGSRVLMGSTTHTTEPTNSPTDIEVEVVGEADWGTWDVHAGYEYEIEITAGGDEDVRYITDFISLTYQEQTGGGAPSNTTALSDGRKIRYIVTPRDG